MTSVAVTGSFDGWALTPVGELRHKPGADTFEVDLALPQREKVTFKFVVNGSHWTTSDAYPIVYDELGNQNNCIDASELVEFIEREGDCSLVDESVSLVEDAPELAESEEPVSKFVLTPEKPRVGAADVIYAKKEPESSQEHHQKEGLESLESLESLKALSSNSSESLELAEPSLGPVHTKVPSDLDKPVELSAGLDEPAVEAVAPAAFSPEPFSENQATESLDSEDGIKTAPARLHHTEPQTPPAPRFTQGITKLPVAANASEEKISVDATSSSETELADYVDEFSPSNPRSHEDSELAFTEVSFFTSNLQSLEQLQDFPHDETAWGGALSSDEVSHESISTELGPSTFKGASEASENTDARREESTIVKRLKNMFRI